MGKESENKVDATVQPIRNILNTDTKAYQIAIENLALNKISKEFSNEGPLHASIVFGNIFKTANDYVLMYSGNFSGDISNRDYYLDNLKGLLKRKTPITIIFQQQPNEESLALNMLKSLNAGNVNIRVLNKHQELFKHHFATADGRMYRIEVSNNFKAECSFNNLDTAQTLEGIHAYLYTNSEAYQSSSK